MSRSIAIAVRGVFRAMELLAESGKVRFGDWAPRLEDALLKPLTKLYSSKLDPEDAGLAASNHAKSAALELVESTRSMLEDGREPRDVFGAARAATVGVTEAASAEGRAKLLVAKRSKRKLRWTCNRTRCCPECASLGGHTVDAGDDFVSRGGLRAKHEPLHPNCDCKVVEVR